MPVKGNYVVVSPAKDEERFIARTIESMIRQTVRPSRWIIVDDGSSDRTASIAASYASIQPWIELLQAQHNGPRLPGSAEVRAFYLGYQDLQPGTFDYIVKLDCDLELPPDYFEKMLARFSADEKLGIASGIYLECSNDQWIPVPMPDYHAAGAAKMIRADCFTTIGGFIQQRGWDNVDEIRAQLAGWKTAHFPDNPFLHLRAEGAAIGFLRTSYESGAGHYLTGGGPTFFALKAVQRLFRGRPPVIGSLAMCLGYLDASIRRRPRLVNAAEADHYRRLLNRRVIERVMQVLAFRNS